MQELAKDVDGYSFSDYLSLDDRKLHHSSPWDVDLAFNFACMPMYYHPPNQPAVLGAVGWNIDNTRDMAVGQGPNGTTLDWGYNIRQFFLNLWQHPQFRAHFLDAWREASGPGSVLSEGGSQIRALVDDIFAPIAASAARDIELWKHTERCGIFKCCHPQDTQNATSSVQHLKEYVADRVRWIEQVGLPQLDQPGRA